MSAAVTTEDICAYTELPTAWCGCGRPTCRPTKRTRDGRVIRRSVPVGSEIRHRFLARYDGTCELCGEEYYAGHTIGITIDERYVCEDCV